MSKTKKFLEQVSVNLGLGGEINNFVLKEAQKILHDEMSRSVVLNQLSLELKTQNVGETNEK